MMPLFNVFSFIKHQVSYDVSCLLRSSNLVCYANLIFALDSVCINACLGASCTVLGLSATTWLDVMPFNANNLELILTGKFGFSLATFD